MKIALCGLGKMGASLAYRLLQAGHAVVGFDPTPQARAEVEKMGATVVATVQETTQRARIFWLMVPAGEVVDNVINELKPGLQQGDIVIDGGNSHFPDSIRRYNDLQKLKVHFIDCGVSGGLKGREIGFSLMVGGDKQIYEHLTPLFTVLAAPNGFGYMGPAGAGHYVKMVHNGVEYAILQAFGEGFHVLREGHYKDLDLAVVAQTWEHGSVIRSWIVELCREVFEDDQTLENVSGSIAENMTGRWTQQEAEKQGIPVRTIQDALDIRAWSRESGGNFGTKVVAMLRNKFGGHTLGKKDENN